MSESAEARQTVWVVERPYFEEGPVPIGWCTTDQRARELAAEYWRFCVWEKPAQITIQPRLMDTGAFASDATAQGWRFTGDADDARKQGWLIFLEVVEGYTA
ncbi:hypothetical protein [Nocardia transvalensis]|uniref:hypothetical protein n=1 Tax=Nocardia transvalensis TaxID=37333 RepID=UPI0005933275|nr:hypothetical protein [Nocardia transvalensis]